MFVRSELSYQELTEYVLKEIGSGRGMTESLSKYGNWTNVAYNPDWTGWEGIFILPVQKDIAVIPYEIDYWDKKKQKFVYGNYLHKLDVNDAYFLETAKRFSRNSHLISFIDECIKTQRVRMLLQFTK